MKKIFSILTIAALLGSLNAIAQNDIESDPGYLDFSSFLKLITEDSKVEVNLRSPLLRMAATLVREESPEAAQLISAIQQVRVRVYSVNDDNRDSFAQSVQEISEMLTSQDWEQLVKVNDEKSNVGIFTRMTNDDVISGIVISVAENDEAVFVNIVGDIALDDIAELGSHLNIPALKKLHKLEKRVEES